jgi:hypothetical protein
MAKRVSERPAASAPQRIVRFRSGPKGRHIMCSRPLTWPVQKRRKGEHGGGFCSSGTPLSAGALAGASLQKSFTRWPARLYIRPTILDLC